MSVQQIGFTAANGAAFALLGYCGAAAVAAPLSVGIFFAGLTGIVNGIALCVINEKVPTFNRESFSKEENRNRSVQILTGSLVLSAAASWLATNLVGGSISAIAAGTIFFAGALHFAIIAAIIAAVTVIYLKSSCTIGLKFIPTEPEGGALRVDPVQNFVDRAVAAIFR